MDNVTIFIIDDDKKVADSIKWLAESVGYQARAFSSAREFLSSYQKEQRGCLILDARMPDISGLELQKMLIKYNIKIPIIFISAYGDIPMAIDTVKSGAIDFLTKPLNNQKLLETINRAISNDSITHNKMKKRDKYDRLVDQLTPREKEIMHYMIDGKPIKVIASILNISPNTVCVHHAKILQKMNVSTSIKLIKLIMQLDISDEVFSD